MNIKEYLKFRLMRTILNSRKRKEPFDPLFSENYQLPEDAGRFDINSYVFSCHNIDGESLMLRHAVRGGGITESWFAYRDVSGNEYIGDQQYYENEPSATSVVCLEPEKRWQFAFRGRVINQKTNEVLPADFKGEFIASRKIFEFTSDLGSDNLAHALAKAKWTKSYFKDLQQHNQVHIEQPGRLEGSMTLGGKKIALHLNAMRDHSYGYRDWDYMNSHFWLTCVFEDGTTFNANRASVPALTVTSGYIEDGEQAVGVKDASVNVVIENYKVPEKFSYSGEFLNGEKFVFDCELQSVFVFPLDNNSYVQYEGFGTFDMNGKKGRGNLEFGFNGNPDRIVTLGRQP